MLAGVCLSVLASTLFGQDDRLPVPSREQCAGSLKLVREIYQDQYLAAATAEAKSALAAKILDAGEATTNDPFGRFVMLETARDIAINGGDIDTTMAAVDLMQEYYQIDSFQMRLNAVLAVTKNLEVDQADQTLELIIDLCQHAVEIDDYQSVNRLSSAAKDVAKRSRNQALRETIDTFVEQLKRIENEFRSIQPDLEKLKQHSDDAAANLAVGKFQCFIKGSWPTGLAMLAKSSDDRLRQVAKLELSETNDGEQYLQIADLWWEYADQLKEPESIEVKLRAGSFYKQASETLAGLQKAKAVSRMREAEAFGEVGSIEIPLAGDKGSNDENRTGIHSENRSSEFGIRPNQMQQDKIVYDLSASFDDVVVAAGGRYLVFQINSLKKLAFFDVNEGKITEYVSLEDTDMRFTAGAESFYIALRRENVIQRWSLKDFKKELTVKLPFENPVDAIVMGSASIGPIYAGAKHAPGVFLNPKTLKPLPYEVLDHVYRRADAEIAGAGPETRLRASANGRAFSLWGISGSPGGFRTLVLTDRQVHTFYKHDTVGYIMPSPDGDLMYTAKGVYTNQTKDYSGNVELFAKGFPVPAVSGSYSLSITRDDDRPNNKKSSTAVHVHFNGQDEPILTLPDISMRPGEYGDFHGRELMTLDKRVYFIPEANLLITLPTSNQTVVMHNVNLDRELEEAGIDYLYVASRPAISLPRGGTFKYQIEVKSRNGGVSYKLESGPAGMKVSDSGLVTWRTSRKSSASEDVIISIRDKSGQEITHAFKIAIE
jgi:chaperonin cofactor prefoldin